MELSNPQSDDKFKNKFKYYKSNKPKPSLNTVLSVNDNQYYDKVKWINTRAVQDDPRTNLLGLKELTQWNSYTFRDHPGLVLIRNPFFNIGQRYWIRRCLEEYSKKPNKTNIDIEIEIQDWWSECFVNGQCNKFLQKKMRWSTLGYHHNWDTKVYTDEIRTHFPEDLAELSDIVAGYIGCSKYRAEAAIINFYHMDSTLSAHTDHSEVNLEAPLLSFSFGQSAIFLIGGESKSIEPSAILLHSGDILVMSKEARLCYHAVPKILPASLSPWNDVDDQTILTCNTKAKYIKNPDEIISAINKNRDNHEWQHFSKYIEESRINMNVRQVLNENQKSLLHTKLYK